MNITSPTDAIPWIGGALAALVALRYLVWPMLRRLLWKLSGAGPVIERLHAQRKSSEVRTGRITEQLAPLLDDFPVDPSAPGTALIFIGQPVDYVYFDPQEGVTFIEVKSGDAKLSPNQKKLKELIQSGRVQWREFRLK